LLPLEQSLTTRVGGCVFSYWLPIVISHRAQQVEVVKGKIFIKNCFFEKKTEKSKVL